MLSSGIFGLQMQLRSRTARCDLYIGAVVAAAAALFAAAVTHTTHEPWDVAG